MNQNVNPLTNEGGNDSPAGIRANEDSTNIKSLTDQDAVTDQATETLFESEASISNSYKKDLRQGPYLHPYPVIVTLSIIALIISVILGSFIVDRYYNKFFTPNYFSAPIDLGHMIDKVQESTVVVICKNSQGSGWAIDLGPVVETANFELKVKDRLFPYSVITNHHVIEGCINEPEKVQISNGVRTYVSSLFTFDEENDLAIVATRARIPTIPFSQRPEPGWWSMALGTPFGLENSVSTGNVMNTLDQGYIISTAPINPGNSGGPLVNSFGEVMGTNTFYLRNTQSFNFASDIDLLCEKLVSCAGDTFDREFADECNAWCEFQRWSGEVIDFVFG